MQCRKCGAKDITRRRAGVFFCQHCGMQPGQAAMDRAGFHAPAKEPAELTPIDYIFSPRVPQLRGKTGAAQ